MGRLHYMVKLDNGYTFKRHINQLIATNVQGGTLSNVQSPPSQSLEKNNQQNSDQQIMFHHGSAPTADSETNRELSEDEPPISQPQESSAIHQPPAEQEP